MYQTIKKNIHIAIIVLCALIPVQNYAMDKLKSMMPGLPRAPKLASMDKPTLEKVDTVIQKADEFLKKLPDVTSQIFHQFAEIVQGSNELSTLKKIQEELMGLIQKIEQFESKPSKHNENKGEADKSTQVLNFINTINETLDSIQTRLEALKPNDAAAKLDEETKADAEKKESSSKVPTISDGKRTMKIKIKDRSERIVQLIVNLDELRQMINSYIQSQESLSLKSDSLVTMKEMLTSYQTTIDAAIKSCRTNSAGVGLFESLESNIKELTEGLHGVVYNFSKSFTVDFKEVIGFPAILKIRKDVCLLLSQIENRPEQEMKREIAKLISYSMRSLADLIDTIKEGTLFDRLVTLNGKFQILDTKLNRNLSINQLSADLLALDKDLEEILTTRSGFLGVLEVWVDSTRNMLKQVANHAETKASQFSDKLYLKIPFCAAATYSVYWLINQWLNDRLDKTGLLKGSSVIAASIAALPCINKIINHFYPIQR